jgi:hypothetical protein
LESIIQALHSLQEVLESPVLLGHSRGLSQRHQEARRSSGIDVGRISQSEQAGED